MTFEPGKQDLTPAELVERCIHGDDEAKARLFLEYRGLVRRAALRKLSQMKCGQISSLDVDDIVNEVFMRLLDDDCRALRQLHNPQSLNAWLMTVAQNHAVTCLRKAMVRGETQQPALACEEPATYTPNPAQSAIRQETAAVLETLLEQLSPDDQIMVNLFFVQRRRYCDIAEIMNLNINTVATRLHRAKAQLRELWRKHDHAFTQS